MTETPQRRLSVREAREIENRNLGGESITKLAKEFGVHYNTAAKYCNAKRRLRRQERPRVITPVVRSFFDAICGQVDLHDLSERSGVSFSAIKDWRSGRQQPRLAMFDALVSAAGYDLHVDVQRKEID